MNDWISVNDWLPKLDHYIDGAANVHIDAQNKAQAALALADGDSDA